MPNLHPRTCRQCGTTFEGGPRAWYCPICREERRKEADRVCHAKMRRGETRQIGSMDVCQICGKEYKVMSGNQKYCQVCAPKAVAEIDRAQGLDYYTANSEMINPARNEKRRKQRAEAKLNPKEINSNINTPKIDFDKYVNLLGTMPDKKLAELIGCAENTVWKRRRDAEIAPFGGEKKAVPWDDISHLIGKISDAEIASLVGCSQSAISMYKAKLNKISRKKSKNTLKENINLLGTMPDSAIADKCGCTESLVALYRKKLGIKSYTGRNGKKRIPWETIDQFLGFLDDSEIANIYGCSVVTIKNRRTLKKIYSNRKLKSSDRPQNKRHRTSIDWEKYDHLLGTMHDNALAEIIGCTRGAVLFRRRIKGIDTIKTMVDWEKYIKYLGKLPDSALARIIGVRPCTVSTKRRKMGIKQYEQAKPQKRKRNSPKRVVWKKYDHLLGVVSAYDLAKKIGCTHQAIYGRMKKLGIKSKRDKTNADTTGTDD